MERVQHGILAGVPAQARYLSFVAAPGADPRPALQRLREYADGDRLVVGFGESLLATLGRPIDGMRSFGGRAAAGLDLPATPAALWCWHRGDDRGDLLHAGRAVEASLAPAFRVDGCIDAFRHRSGLDLSGYEDGTENPTGEAAVAAATASGRGPGLDGSSFVAVQQWLHDLPAYDAMSPAERDAAIGRRLADNEEIDDAPPSAHVKRTAQESFDPEAFVLRRSMPWADAQRCGLVFVAFGRSLDAFEAQLNRMVGAEDGITDALFRFTRPIGGAYFWCPPMRDGRIDLRALGL